MKAKKIFGGLGNLAFGLSGTFLIASLLMSLFLAQRAYAANKVEVCHWTGLGKYVLIDVSVSAVNKWITQGHGTHPNDVWDNFTTEDGRFVAGQGDPGILENGCEVPATATLTQVPPTSTKTDLPPTATDTLTPSPSNTPKHTPGADKVDICHWTGAEKYVLINVSVSAVNKWLTQGHGSHPYDIWADFTTEDGYFVEGQGDINILNNGCVVPATPTYTEIPPTQTGTRLSPTPTFTPTFTETPTSTSTNTSTSTLTSTPTSTLTNTPVPVTPVIDKVNICHWTGSDKYTCHTIDVSALNKWVSQGHGNHPKDIWPDFMTGDGYFVAGQGDINILNNGCIVAPIPTQTTFTPIPTGTPTFINTPETLTPTGTLPTQTSTATHSTITITYTPDQVTSTETLTTFTPTGTPPTPTSTIKPTQLTSTVTQIPISNTDIPPSPTLPLIPAVVNPPSADGSNIIFPVTGLDLGTFSRALPDAFANICLGFLGVGLVLKGIARRYHE